MPIKGFLEAWAQKKRHAALFLCVAFFGILLCVPCASFITVLVSSIIPASPFFMQTLKRLFHISHSTAVPCRGQHFSLVPALLFGHVRGTIQSCETCSIAAQSYQKTRSCEVEYSLCFFYQRPLPSPKGDAAIVRRTCSMRSRCSVLKSVRCACAKRTSSKRKTVQFEYTKSSNFAGGAYEVCRNVAACIAHTSSLGGSLLLMIAEIGRGRNWFFREPCAWLVDGELLQRNHVPGESVLRENEDMNT